MKRSALVLALFLVSAAVAQPPAGGVGDPFLHNVIVHNQTGRPLNVWIQAEDVDGRIHQVPGRVHGRDLYAHPSQSGAGYLATTIYIGAWDGINQSQTIRVRFNGGPSTRRYRVELVGQQITFTEF